MRGLTLPRQGPYEYRVRRTETITYSLADDDCERAAEDAAAVTEVVHVDAARGLFTMTDVDVGEVPQRRSLTCRIDKTRLWRMAAETELSGIDDDHRVAARLDPPVVVLDLDWRPGHRFEQSWRLDGELIAGDWLTTVRYAGATEHRDAAGRAHRVVRTNVEERCLDNGSVTTLDTWFSVSLGVPIETVSRTAWREAGVELRAVTRSTLHRVPT